MLFYAYVARGVCGASSETTCLRAADELIHVHTTVYGPGGLWA
jgi:hypothetical protein